MLVLAQNYFLLRIGAILNVSPLASHEPDCFLNVSSLTPHELGCFQNVSPLASHDSGCFLNMISLNSYESGCFTQFFHASYTSAVASGALEYLLINSVSSFSTLKQWFSNICGSARALSNLLRDLLTLSCVFYCRTRSLYSENAFDPIQ